MIYLDNNATTRTAPLAVTAMLPFFTTHYGNPSSAHGVGSEAAAALRQARRSVQALVGAAQDHEIVFTSGGTEANATAIRSALAVQPGRTEVVVSTVEHPSVLSMCDALERFEGIKVHRIAVDGEGRLDLDAYRAALSERVALVSLMWANNETGTVFPVDGLAELAHGVGALFHSDAVQAAGKLPLRVSETSVDLLSLSAHKFHGPKGVGALYVRKGTPFRSLLRGGKQERGRRAGTENLPGIVGAGVAADLALAALAQTPRIAALRDRLETGVLARIGGVTRLGDLGDRLPNTSALAFDLVQGEAIQARLNALGIAVSTGSACSSGAVEPSHVVRAMKIHFTVAHGVVRFSLSAETTEAEIARVIEVLPGILADLRGPAPVAAPAREAAHAG
ncbi:aminotransferase class V-fold PLP-dependent enzyme [Rhodobacter sp. Har01]|uniref:aminotransferase class V-fold PLP-dependent enzyme n=1 Tax=Rhodobacter sp. Har01 TaxID=2883999 RepID=UPI001D0756FF|nr:aminotransferase class V-fold PLP-dependent enzyme [Rhodobacter sp. Har01]MCB6178321.1 aminotransferase class V-fold PLP-dependent enzyme [Rhodobacter sp. Har01]